MTERIDVEFRSGDVRCAATLYRADDGRERVRVWSWGPAAR